LTESVFQFGITPFLFLRHGETKDSERGIVQGQRETVLSNKGRLTAWKAAKLLSHARPGSIYSSPLRRAWETAEIISRVTAIPIVPLPGLMERNWGNFQGRPTNDRFQMSESCGVESKDFFRARVLAAMNSIRGPLPVLVVAHSGVYRLLCDHVGLPVDRRNAVANGLVYKFSPPERGRARWHLDVVVEREG